MSEHNKRKKRQLLERDGVWRSVDGIQAVRIYRCYLCKNEYPADELEIEHKMPVSRGGTFKLDNLGLACTDCNTRKANMTEEEYREYEYYLEQYSSVPEITEVSSSGSLGRHRLRKIRGITHALSDYWPDQQDKGSDQQ